MDAKEGLVAADFEVAELLRRTKKPVIVVVNKVETATDEEAVYDFYQLGIGDVFAISSSQGLGLGDLLDEVVRHFGQFEVEEEEEACYVAFVGKPNVGKSSLTNKILGHERSIVSDIPGTTRDAIDSSFYRDGKNMC